MVACDKISFLFKAEYYSIIRKDCILLIHSSVDGHLGCFHLLAIVNNAAMNMDVQVSVGVPAFSVWGYCSEIRSLDHDIVLFDPPTAFLSGCPISQSHQVPESSVLLSPLRR